MRRTLFLGLLIALPCFAQVGQHAIAENWYILYQEMNSGPQRKADPQKDSPDPTPARAALQ